MKLRQGVIRYKSLFLFLIVFIFLNSCYKERFGLDKLAGGTYSPDIAAPIIFRSLSMREMVDKSHQEWKEYPDGFLSLIYRADGFSDIAHQVLTIPDQSEDTSIAFVLPPGLSNGDSISHVFSMNADFSFGNNEYVDSILIKKGTISVELITDVNHKGYIELSIPEMTKNGVAFREKLSFNYTGSPISVKRDISVAGYYLKLKKGAAGADNYIEESFKVLVTKTSNPDNSPYHFQLKQEFKDIEYKLVFGYFGLRTFSIDETEIPIELFETQATPSLFLENPQLYVTFNNSYGLPATVHFSEFYAERNGVKKNITSSVLPDIPINYPSFSDIGGYDTTSIHFDNINSNLADVFKINPEKLVFKGDVTINPSAQVLPNFVLDTSHIMVDLMIELPLFGRALQFELQDTIDITNDLISNVDDLERLQFNLNADNGFPVDAYLQVYLADSNDVIYDSLLREGSQLLKPGVVGPAPDYRVIAKTKHMAKIVLNPKQLESFKKASKLILSSKLSTADGGSKIVKIYNDYAVFIEVSARGVYQMDF